MKYLNYKILTLFTFIFFIPVLVFGASIDIENKDKDAQEGDIIIFDVYVNSADEINSIEGSISIQGDYSIKDITTAGSIFDMWPNKPSFEDGAISFVGGSASSVFGNRLKLFSIIAQVNSEEGIVFSSNQAYVFLNNGIGTKVNVDLFKKEIVLAKSDGDTVDTFKELVSSDQEPPRPFEVIIGRDQNSFDGKYFASFNTVDKDSGIERYEIIEGDTKTPVLTGTTYVLQNQSLRGTLIVRAIDKAGNVQVTEIKIKDAVSEQTPINWISLLIALAILFILFIFTKKIKIKNVRI